MRVATVVAPNGLRPRAALSLPTNDEPRSKIHPKPETNLEVGSPLVSNVQTTAGILIDCTAKAVPSFQDRDKRERNQVTISQSCEVHVKEGEK
jgi:hypothetical protein